MATLIKKITVKDCTGFSEADLKALGAKGESVLKIAGVIEGVTQKATAYGAATAFLGDFVAQNNAGETFSANVMYMPDRNATESMESRVIAMAANGGSVEFSGEVVVVESVKSKTGYSYIFRAIRTEEKEAKQQSLLALLNNAPAQIESK